MKYLKIVNEGPYTRGRKLINKLVINKLEKYKFFHVGKNKSHPRKSEKI